MSMPHIHREKQVLPSLYKINLQYLYVVYFLDVHNCAHIFLDMDTFATSLHYQIA